MQTKRLIEKDSTYKNSYEYESKQSTVPMQRMQSIDRDKMLGHNSSIENKKSQNQSHSHYSFNDDKPERVKILKKHEIESIHSLQSSKKSLSKQDKQKIAKEVTSRLYNESDIKKNYLNKIKERAKQQK